MQLKNKYMCGISTRIGIAAALNYNSIFFQANGKQLYSGNTQIHYSERYKESAFCG